jgi:hypothetical protein
MTAREDPLRKKMKQDTHEVSKAALAAVDPEKAIDRHFRVDDGQILVGETRLEP